MIRTMRAALAAIALALGCAGALAQSAFPTPGGSYVDGHALMCPNGSADFQGRPIMIPCGGSGSPINVAGSFSATFTAGWVDGAGATGNPFTLTSTPTSVTLPSPFTNFIVQNTGATNDMVCQPGASITNAGITVPAKQTIEFLTGASTQVTCSSASGTTLSVRSGSGFYNGVGGGGGGGGGGSGPLGVQAIANSQAVNPATSSLWTVAQGGSALSATNGIFSNVLQSNAVISATNPLFFAPSTTAGMATAANQEVTAAGTSAASAQAVQGVTNGVPQPMSITTIIITPTDCSVTATGSSQTVITSAVNLHKFTIANIDPTTGAGEPFWMSFTGAAVVGAKASYPSSAPIATTYSGMGSYTDIAPTGTVINENVTVIATSGHLISCTRW